MLPTPLSGSPQKEIPLYMLKDRTKQALRFSEEQKYDMLCEGKCLEQYFRITVAFWIIIKLNVVLKLIYTTFYKHVLFCKVIFIIEIHWQLKRMAPSTR